MKALCFGKRSFTSKKGDQWVAFSFLSEKGKVGEALMRAEDFASSNPTEKNFVDSSKLIEQLPAFDLSFDQTGRLESIVDLE